LLTQATFEPDEPPDEPLDDELADDFSLLDLADDFSPLDEDESEDDDEDDEDESLPLDESAELFSAGFLSPGLSVADDALDALARLSVL
jgi:hypothetical protein